MKSSLTIMQSACCVIAFGSGIAFSFQDAAGDAGTVRERETYRIYSQLLNDPQTSNGPDARYMIKAIARVEPWQEAPCVAPPASRQEEFREVLADFESRKTRPRLLKRQFTIGKDYELLADADVAGFQGQSGLAQPSGREGNQGGVKRIMNLYSFSDVYFSLNGGLALTAMSTWCGGLCGKHRWHVFEKTRSTGEWQEQPWVTCFSVAGLPNGALPLPVRGALKSL